jgi:hypothetical protein
MPVPCSQPQAIPSMYMFSLLFVERNVNIFFFSLLLTVTVLFKRIFGALLTGSKRALKMFFFSVQVRINCNILIMYCTSCYIFWRLFLFELSCALLLDFFYTSGRARYKKDFKWNKHSCMRITVRWICNFLLCWVIAAPYILPSVLKKYIPYIWTHVSQ